jgi:FixJ family two-component response regulator
MSPNIHVPAEAFFTKANLGRILASSGRQHGAIFNGPGSKWRWKVEKPVHSDADPTVFVVDDSVDVREGLKVVLESVGLQCEAFGSTKEFLLRKPTGGPSCLILDIRLPGASGLDFQTELSNAQIHIPIIFITGYGDIPMSVRAMRAGAVEFLTKPLRDQDLIDAVNVALQRDRVEREQQQKSNELRVRFETLSNREREVMSLVTAGLLNKEIAAEVGLSEVTVKVHRHNLMVKMEAKSLAHLVRMADTLGVTAENKR